MLKGKEKFRRNKSQTSSLLDPGFGEVGASDSSSESDDDGSDESSDDDGSGESSDDDNLFPVSSSLSAAESIAAAVSTVMGQQ